MLRRVPQTRLDYEYLGDRVVVLILLLGTLSAFLLPWVWLEHRDTPSSGLELLVLLASESGETQYMSEAVPIEAVIVVGAPILAAACVVLAMFRYRYAEAPIFLALVMVACAVGLDYVVVHLKSPVSESSYLGLKLLAMSSGLIVLYGIGTKLYPRLRARFGRGL